MICKIGIIFYYTKPNRYSINVLTGAISNSKELSSNVHFFFPENENSLNYVIKKVINNYEKLLVCFSFHTIQFLEIKKIINDLKKFFKNDKIIFLAGGPHSSANPKEVLESGFDFVAIGESEETFSEIVKALKNNENLKDIKGLAYIENGILKYKKRDDFVNLDDYPPFDLKNLKFNPIEITRGCLNFCHFCQTPFLFGNKLRHRSIENICKYVKIMKKLKLTDIRFISPDALSYGATSSENLNLKLIEELLKSIRNIIGKDGRIFFGTFPSEVRPENLTENALLILKKYVDNDNLIIGAQSGSNRILKLLNRGHTVEDVFNAVKLAIKFGFKVNVDFIFRLPYENEEDIEQTIEVIEKLIELKVRIHAHTFMPLPQTPLANMKPQEMNLKLKNFINKLIGKGLIYGDWEKQSNYIKETK